MSTFPQSAARRCRSEAEWVLDWIGKFALREYVVRRGGRILGSVRSTQVLTHAVITWNQTGLPRIEVASWHGCFDAATEALRALKRDNPDLGADIALALLADGPALL